MVRAGLGDVEREEEDDASPTDLAGEMDSSRGLRPRPRSSLLYPSPNVRRRWSDVTPACMVVVVVVMVVVVVVETDDFLASDGTVSILASNLETTFISVLAGMTTGASLAGTAVGTTLVGTTEGASLVGMATLGCETSP